MLAQINWFCHRPGGKVNSPLAAPIGGSSRVLPELLRHSASRYLPTPAADLSSGLAGLETRSHRVLAASEDNGLLLGQLAWAGALYTADVRKFLRPSVRLRLDSTA
jgi:hypothetical protein